MVRRSGGAVTFLAIAVAILLGPKRPMSVERQNEQFVPSRPDTLSWGWFPTDASPVLTIQSGETVRIDTLSHAGATQDAHPETSLAELGVGRDEILQDVLDFWASRVERPRNGRAGHAITGPVYIDGAEPGDMFEVEILELRTRVPYGINNTGQTSGVFGPSYPGTRSNDPSLDIAQERHLIRTAMVDGREVALFSNDIHVPLAPFMGIMAVAPERPMVEQPGVTVPGVQSSRPPGPFGGNMDLKDLTAGATLYLPIFHAGARFYVGDPHSAQGDGEVSGTAIEQSLTGIFRFTVHKGTMIVAPRAETNTHYIHDGDRSRPGPSVATGGSGGRPVSRGAERADIGQSVLAGQHRRRLPRGGSS